MEEWRNRGMEVGKYRKYVKQANIAANNEDKSGNKVNGKDKRQVCGE